ncbi:5,10-methylene tetrahydromethanopterin reductase, partial [Acinetobacter baumannii]
SYDGALTLLSCWSGVDFSQYQPTYKVEYIQTNAIQSLLDSYVNADPERVWTIEEIANWNSLGGNGPVLVGSAETVSDAL